MRRFSMWFNLILGFLLLGFTIEQVVMPTRWWFEVRKVYVPDFAVGDPLPLVAVDDTIHQSFIGHFFIDIRKVGESQTAGAAPDLTRFTYFCAGSGEISFQPGVDPTSKVNLEWWTRNKCPAFAEGSYYAHIIIEWRDILVTRSLSIDSNVWQVFVPAPVVAAAAPQVIVQKPIIVQRPVVVRKVYRSAKCQPSFIPPRACPPSRRRR